MNRQQLSPRIDPLPPTIDSPRAKLVYLYLDSTDGATVEELNRVLVMKKISILCVLNSLSESGLVEAVGDEYVTRT